MIWIIPAVLLFFTFFGNFTANHLGNFLETRRLKREGRFMPWECVAEKLRAGEGTLIINSGNQPGLVWWTAFEGDLESPYFNLSHNSFITNCPFWYRTLPRAKKTFTNAKIHEYLISTT